MYYIYDANGQLFGNPKGYKTHGIAQGICTRYRGKLWAIYDERINKDDNTVWRIRCYS